jgi:hypothetical protein
LSTKVDPKQVDPVTTAKVKAYGKRVAQNTITDWVFGGQFINTIVCEECNHPSQRVEPFLDISLPILDEKVDSEFIYLRLHFARYNHPIFLYSRIISKS